MLEPVKLGLTKGGNMLKITSAGIAAAILLTAAYSRADDETNAASRRSSVRTNRDPASKLSPTSHETNSSSRVYSPETATGTNAAEKDADNTGRNIRDRSYATLTPGDQGSNASDLELTRRIRRALNKND